MKILAHSSLASRCKQRRTFAWTMLALSVLLSATYLLECDSLSLSLNKFFYNNFSTLSTQHTSASTSIAATKSTDPADQRQQTLSYDTHTELLNKKLFSQTKAIPSALHITLQDPASETLLALAQKYADRDILPIFVSEKKTGIQASTWAPICHLFNLWQSMLLMSLPVFVVMFVAPYLLHRSLFFLTILLTLSDVFYSYFMWLFKFWLAPMPGLWLSLLCYPVWCLLIFFTDMNYIASDLDVLIKKMPFRLNLMLNNKVLFDLRELIAQNIDKIQQATMEASDLHKFTSDTLENSPHVILVIDTCDKLMLFNKKASTLFTFLENDLLHGHGLDVIFDRFVDPFDMAGTSIAWCDLTTFVGGTAPIIVQLQTRDWKECDYYLNIMVMRHADNNISGYIFVLMDINNMRQEEQSRDELFQFTSHDMRGLQSSILALLKLQNQPDHALSDIEFIARIESSVNKTLKLAENMIQIEKAQSFKYQLHEIDFLSLVSDVRDEMWPLATSKKISIFISEPDNMVWVLAERDLLWRVLSNLLSNAIKFSPSGSQIHIEIKLLQQASTLMVSCAIIDSGIGISEIDQNRLFKPFVRVGVRHTEGTGLGLAFAKLVIERHYGMINLTSHIGKGSCFKITLPCMAD